MEIRFSKYNFPFCEPHVPGVHYISLDDQCDIRAGNFDAHVRAFYSQFPPVIYRSFRTFRVDQFLDVVDPLTGTVFIHDLSANSRFPLRPSVEVVSPKADIAFVDQLRKSGIKAAGPRMSLCKCGNSRSPWKCVCHKNK